MFLCQMAVLILEPSESLRRSDCLSDWKTKENMKYLTSEFKLIVFAIFIHIKVFMERSFNFIVLLSQGLMLSRQTQRSQT